MTNVTVLGTNGPVLVTEIPCIANEFHGNTLFYGSMDDYLVWSNQR